MNTNKYELRNKFVQAKYFHETFRFDGRNQRVSMPPPFNHLTLRVFLRKYPERIHFHTNISDNSIWVERSTPQKSLPVFTPYPHNLGNFPHYSASSFNWDDYIDIDDKYKVEQFEFGPDEDEKGNEEKLTLRYLLKLVPNSN